MTAPVGPGVPPTVQPAKVPPATPWLAPADISAWWRSPRTTQWRSHTHRGAWVLWLASAVAFGLIAGTSPHRDGRDAPLFLAMATLAAPAVLTWLLVALVLSSEQGSWLAPRLRWLRPQWHRPRPRWTKRLPAHAGHLVIALLSSLTWWAAFSTLLALSVWLSHPHRVPNGLLGMSLGLLAFQWGSAFFAHLLRQPSGTKEEPLAWRDAEWDACWTTATELWLRLMVRAARALPAAWAWRTLLTLRARQCLPPDLPDALVTRLQTVPRLWWKSLLLDPDRNWRQWAIQQMGPLAPRSPAGPTGR